MTIRELHFPAPGWKFYGQGITVFAFGIGLVGFGVLVVAFDPWNWVGIISMLGGIFGIAAGTALILLVWFIVIYGTVASWQDWRQLRPPAVVIDAAGAHYQAPRPVTIPWADIEQIRLKRTIFPDRVIAKVSLRLTPGAALIRDGSVKIPASRYLKVGLLSEIDIPEYVAVRFLAKTAGTSLEIEEIDRRPTATDTNRY